MKSKPEVIQTSRVYPWLEEGAPGSDLRFSYRCWCVYEGCWYRLNHRSHHSAQAYVMSIFNELSRVEFVEELTSIHPMNPFHPGHN